MNHSTGEHNGISKNGNKKDGGWGIDTVLFLAKNLRTSNEV